MKIFTLFLTPSIIGFIIFKQTMKALPKRRMFAIESKKIKQDKFLWILSIPKNWQLLILSRSLTQVSYQPQYLRPQRTKWVLRGFTLDYARQALTLILERGNKSYKRGDGQNMKTLLMSPSVCPFFLFLSLQVVVVLRSLNFVGVT